MSLFTVLQYIKSCQVSENDCFILLSYNGETTRILQLFRNLKLRHASFIAVTSKGNNHLSMLAPCVLHMSLQVKISHNISDFATKLSVCRTL